jgi:amino acid transporter
MTDAGGQSDPIQSEHDAQQLAAFGYKQELQRSLGQFSNFAVPFSYISPSVGIFGLFGLGLSSGGPAFVWSWPLVFAGQFLVALVFAELASHYPLAGSVYQWARRLSSPSTAWFIGWFYLFATILTLTGVSFTMPGIITTLFPSIPNTPNVQVEITVVALALSTLINVAGVRFAAYVNNAGVAAEIIGTIGFSIALLVLGHHQSLGVIFDTAGTQHTWSTGYVGAFTLAMFMSLWVIFGFDAAGTVGEETLNPSRRAPIGVLSAMGVVAVAGLLFLLANVLAIKSVPAVIAAIAKGSAPLPLIIGGALGARASDLYLVVVAAAIFAAMIAIQATCIRLLFSMGRDNQLPFSNLWRVVHPTFETPMWAGIAVGLLAMLPLAVSQQIGVVTAGATGMIYLCYLLTCLVVFAARRRGWPRTPAHFNLRRGAMPITIVAILWPAVMLINFAWPRAATNPAFGSAFPSIANAPILGGAPIYELSVAVVLFVGVVYWFLVQRHRVDTHFTASEAVASGPEMSAPLIH